MLPKIDPIDSKQWSISDWERMYMNATDPEKREEARRNLERKARIEQKKRDTGL